MRRNALRTQLPAQRPHRLEPRYPVACELRVCAPGAAPVSYRARDVSRGGVFLSCRVPLELFHELHVMLPNRDSEVAVPARVMHTVSLARAGEHGIEPGMGLQFEPAQPEQRVAILAFVETARCNDVRLRLPVRRAGGDAEHAPSDPILGYILEAIDGERGPEELAELLGLPVRQVEEALGELVQLGVLELRSRVRSVPPPAAVPLASARPARRSPARRELAPQLRVELIELWSRLGAVDHYQALGVTRAAGREEIRHAFFDLSKRFHPDAHYRRSLGDDLPKLERVFARLSEAYGVLGRPDSRAEYDRYLDRRRALTHAPPALVHDVEVEQAPALAFQLAAGEQPASRQLWEAATIQAAHRELVAALRVQAAYEEQHQRWFEAADTWQRVCREDQRDATAHRRAAQAVQHAGLAVDAALELARRAVDLAPEDAQNHRVLGQLYLAAGQKRKARGALETALALSSTTPTIPASPAP